MLSEGHGVHGGGEMGVVGDGNRDCVDLLAHLVEHESIVGEALGIGIIFERPGGAVFEVDVADSDDVAVHGSSCGVGAAFAADANTGDVESPVMGAVFVVSGSQDIGESKSSRGESAGFKKRTPVWSE